MSKASWIPCCRLPRFVFLPGERKCSKEVDEVWDPAKRDGTLLSVYSFSLEEVLLEPVPYRFYWAQSQGVALASPVRPLAVMGVLFQEGRVLVGRRGKGVTQEPGKWEFVPSGSLQLCSRELDPAIQLFEELEEELQLLPDSLEELSMWGWLRSGEPETFDLCLKGRLKKEAHPQKDGKEVRALRWVPPALLQEENPLEWVEGAPQIWSAFIP